ncbi:unnamed protein product [Discula destructiva]
MNQAEKVVDEHLAKDGEETTTVHQHAMPAVEHEYVQKEQKEKEHVAIDRERHQDHYHTKVQPIQDKEILPEQHHHVREGSEKREFHHGDDQEAERRLEDEAEDLGVHTNQREVGATHVTEDKGEVVEGEHIHHHVYENVQPVIQKETIEPHVVHKTKTIKEVHQHEPQHHEATQLPPVSIEEFRKQGGKLDGAGERVEKYDGEPNEVSVDKVAGYSAPSTRQTSRAEASEDGAPVVDGAKEEPSLLKKMVMGAGL